MKKVISAIALLTAMTGAFALTCTNNCWTDSSGHQQCVQQCW